ncbi:two-component sensor histidine kinase [Streptomyces shenzhenensis]|uniref:histidine kinase n=2 Tax=Streptomyces shenzhenensis TaxID=943815 RepID=A0A3M0I1U3_9ACTN|nr:two-component sensor histidine kinase [Streptomyces shenzhenensis]
MDQPPHIRQWPPWPALVVTLLSSGAFLAHRRLPRLTVVATTACGTALGAMSTTLNYEFGSTTACTVMAALASLALHSDQRTTIRYTAACALTLLAASVLWAPEGPRMQPEQVGLVGFVLLASAVADSTRSRRGYVAAVEARAELAERTREDEARHRVGAERMRIARDLHDVVAHHITLAHAQAATAEYLLPAKLDQAQDALRHLTSTLLSALEELRTTVGLLRQSGHEAPLEPAPGLAQLPALLASFAHAGLTVDVIDDGPEQPLSPGVDLTAFRIVQEALTNVTKHADTTRASLQLAYTTRLLTITIRDDGPAHAAADTVTGYGLIGMRERALAVGGRLQARPQAVHGFEVIAELPTHPPHRRRPATGRTAHDHPGTARRRSGAPDRYLPDPHQCQ